MNKLNTKHPKIKFKCELENENENAIKYVVKKVSFVIQNMLRLQIKHALIVYCVL